jgi:hypothetical protein
MSYPAWLKDNDENYRFLLKKYSAYSDEQAIWSSSFSCKNADSDSGLLNLKETYCLDKLSQNRTDVDTCLKAMEWTFCQLASAEQEEFAGPLRALEILKFSRTRRVTVNCLCHATVLTEVLLALGFKARAISCLPIDLVPIDNHVVIVVFIASLNKWVMLDPSLCCYIKDEEGTMLSLREIRECLIGDKPLEICRHSRFQRSGAPNSSFTSFDSHEYRVYLMKNLFRFMSRCVQSASLPAPGDIYYSLVPKGFLVPNTEQAHTERGTRIIRFTDNADFFWQHEEPLEENNDL